ncbi:MAG: RNA polymerase sigma factor region1.1 domain-containing protein, partial [Hyphomonadaceae bacterium]
MSKASMSKTEETTAEEKDAPEGPILDLSDAAVKKMIKAAKTRGFVTHEELNKVLPSDEFDSEAIENVMSQLNEMGINVVDNEEEGEAAEDESKQIATRDEAKPPVTNTREDADRTDDPVRMYLREMGSVELLSREGEIAIAKRIEAGRDAMIRGLCESPLTFEAIMVWRDELREQKILLRDIIDLEATYGAEMGIVPQSAPGVNADGLVDPEQAKIEIAEQERKKAEKAAAQRAALSQAPAAAPAPQSDEDGEERDPGEAAAEADSDSEFDDEQAISMSAMEAELKEGVMSTLDAIAEAFGQFRKLQEKRIDLRLKGKSLPGAQAENYEIAQNTIIEELKKLKLNNARI